MKKCIYFKQCNNTFKPRKKDIVRIKGLCFTYKSMYDDMCESCKKSYMKAMGNPAERERLEREEIMKLFENNPIETSPFLKL